MSGGNQVPAGGPREARESLRGWLGRGLARPSVFLSEQRQALRHLVRLLTDVLANSQKKKCRDIPRGVLRTLRAKARACTGRVGRAGLSVFAGAQAQVREGGLHVLIVSFHERFRFPFSTFTRSLAGAPEGSRVQRSPGPKLLASANISNRNFPASSVSHIKPLERLERWRASRVCPTMRFLQIQFKKSKSTVADDREPKEGGCSDDQK